MLAELSMWGRGAEMSEVVDDAVSPRVSALDSLFAVGRARRLNAGDVLVRQGDLSDDVFLCSVGHVWRIDHDALR